MEIDIRKVSEADYREIFSLYHRELNKEICLSDFVKRIRLICADVRHDIFVAIYDGCVVGFIALERASAIECDYLKINGIAIKEQHQGQGIGSLLLEYAELYAKEYGIDLIALNSSVKRERAHRFYERAGYSATSYSFRKQLDV